MTKRIIFPVLLVLILLSSGAISADPPGFSERDKPSPRYFLYNIGYRTPLNRNVMLNSGHGLCFEGGFNAGRLFSKKILLGLYAGWAWKDGLWNTSFTNDFKD